MRAEQGTEIKRGAGAWDPTPERQLLAKRLRALGQPGPGPGLGAAREGQEGTRGPEAEGTLKMQSPSVTCFRGRPAPQAHA